MSANAGLNWLAHNTRQLFGYLLGPVTPFSGLAGETDNQVAYETAATYRIRHETNSLRWWYSLDCARDGTMHGKLVYDGNDLAGTEQSAPGGSYAEFDGTADLSGLGLTVGEFYDVELQIKVDSYAGWGRVWLLAEQTTTAPTLITFADEVTPTAAQWQALADAGQAVMEVLDAPNAPLIGYGNNVRSDFDEDWVWWGVMAHACRYLTVSAGIRNHEDCDVYLKFYVDGTERLTLRVDEDDVRWVTVSPGAEAAYTEVDTGEPNYTPVNGETIFCVTADMAGWGLSLGDEYQIQVKLSWSDTGEEGVPDIGAAVHYLFETPEGSPTLAGYTEPPIWAYADYVYGDSTAKQVDTLRADIETLAAAAVMQNRAAPYWNADMTDAWPWNVRKHRWLHYANQGAVDEEPADTAEIRWHNGAEWRETSLPDSDGAELVADLASFSGLFPGVRYQLNRALWAIEDSEI